MKEVLYWDSFFNDKGDFNSSPYFMLNHDLKQKNLQIAKENIKEFTSAYLLGNNLCGTNKESFNGVNSEFSFWHYHCEPYNKNTSIFYHDKKCFDKKKYSIIKNKICNNCISLNHKLGRESSHVIYYVKFHQSDIIGIVAYGEQHNPFPKLEDATIQSVMKAKKINFIKK